MNYRESLLELIKNKKELHEENTICLSIGDIARAWNINAEQKTGDPTLEVVDTDFLQDVLTAFKDLENKKFIKLKYIKKYYLSGFEAPISDITHRPSLNDKIYLEVEKKAINQIKKNTKIENTDEIGRAHV